MHRTVGTLNWSRQWIDPNWERGNHQQKPDSLEYGRHTTESREWKNTGSTMVTSVWYNLKLPPGKENHRRKWKLCKVQRQLMSWQWRVTTLIRDCGLGSWLKRRRQEQTAIILPSSLLPSVVKCPTSHCKVRILPQPLLLTELYKRKITLVISGFKTTLKIKCY